MRTIEEILAEMQGIIDASAGRSLTDDEVTNYQALETELQATRRSGEITARHAAYNTPVTTIGPVAEPKPDNGLDKAFDHFLRSGKPNADMVDLQVTNAQSGGTASEGGYLVPEGFRVKLIERMKAFGGIAGIAEELTTSSGNPLPWPTVDDTANVGEIVSDGGTFVSQADMVFGAKSLGAYSYMTGGSGGSPLRLPLELIQDSAFDLQSLLARLLGIRLARVQSTHLATGTGAGQPEGLVYGLTGVEPAADTAGITYDDLLTFIHSVDPAYRGSARWVFNDSSLKTLRQIKDSNGDPLWRSMTSTMGDSPSDGMLLGYPYTIDQSMPNIDIDNNTVNWGAFGDIREGYVVRRVRDVQLVVNPWTRAAYRQIEYTAWGRMDAAQQNPNAYVALTGEQ